MPITLHHIRTSLLY